MLRGGATGVDGLTLDRRYKPSRAISSACGVFDCGCGQQMRQVLVGCWVYPVARSRSNRKGHYMLAKFGCAEPHFPEARSNSAHTDG
jgi:hypothetical protein